MLKKYFNFTHTSKKKRKGFTQNKTSLFSSGQQTVLFKSRRKKLYFHGLHNYLKKSHIHTFSLFGIIGAIFIIILGYILFFSSYTNIKNIYIYRENSLVNIQQSYSQVDYLRGKNIFTIESKDVAQRLQKNQKSLASIKIDINFPKSINIYLASYSPIFQTDTYLILTNGSILEKQGKEYSDIPTIQISQDLGEYINYNDTLSSQEIQKIQLLLEESKKNILGFFPSHILYFPQEKELIIQDMNGVFYIFDLGISLSGQVKKLAIYNKESNSSLDSFLYIDLRITDRIFTCTKEISTICANNLITIYGNFIKLHLQKEAS